LIIRSDEDEGVMILGEVLLNCFINRMVLKNSPKIRIKNINL
jgi:hypothetical protein